MKILDCLVGSNLKQNQKSKYSGPYGTYNAAVMIQKHFRLFKCKKQRRMHYKRVLAVEFFEKKWIEHRSIQKLRTCIKEKFNAIHKPKFDELWKKLKSSQNSINWGSIVIIYFCSQEKYHDLEK